ncbi:MAG: exodeoxyribonuclease VII large subunit, partial [Pseudomonadota bacterium]
MADTSPPDTNLQELSVSDLAGQVKRSIETSFDHVRVRGELGRVTLARSGHLYADLKDDKAVLNTVMWKGQVSRLPFKPEEGLEVVATGRLSTYAGRSAYQLIADTMRPAGAGALMALLEERKKKLAAEGLFAAERKRPLPHLPRTVGVVTSPTGAVIRDILHRIRDRFPVRVIVGPALVQGDLAAGQIEAGIKGFNALTGADRPDVLIVARGGGSIEDLWPFNEEAVVRAAAASEIPLISAVGHETDTTLIDYVSDARAPTPTGAAEIAVPVRADLLSDLDALSARLGRSLSVRIANATDRLRAARPPRPQVLLQPKAQRLDLATARFGQALERFVARKRTRFAALALPAPETVITLKSKALDRTSATFAQTLQRAVSLKRRRYTEAEAALRPQALRAELPRKKKLLRDVAIRARPALMRSLDRRSNQLNAVGKLLDTLSHKATLKRGFAVV